MPRPLAVRAAISGDAFAAIDATGGRGASDADMARHLDTAVNGLHRGWPELSAAGPLSGPLRVGFAIVILFAPLGYVLAPDASRAALLALLSIPFLCLAIVRLMALGMLAHRAMPDGAIARTDAAALSDDDLPSYSILVALYNEAAVVPALVSALGALDYPCDRLEVIFITEADDAATRDALAQSGLPPHMRIVCVPAGTPKTKPRALNFGLRFAIGELLAIYDAEDVPDADQLRVAVAAFRAHGPAVSALQARLCIYNPAMNAITRQFTLEYTALFDAMLPALARIGWPIPLGGTSNHFRRAALEAAGAWDPYNVTEDADLGLRMARLGQRIALIGSTTWEEAPATARGWFGQRTRWLKGWMQTYLVHMRQPLRLKRELGLRAFLGFQVIFGGMVLSALVHPWVYVMLASDVVAGRLGAGATDPTYGWVWWIALFNLVVGYGSAMALVAMAVARRGGRLLVRSAFLVPVYWLAISLASYKALYDLAMKPYDWTKTEHLGLGRSAATSNGAAERRL
ncbi:MAG: glycosyltransferase [Hyphomicrobium sp.]